MKFNRIAVLALSASLTAGFVACSDDPENPSTNPQPTPEPDKNITGVLSVEEAGVYIEDTAKELDKICNPNDQTAAVSSLNAIAEVLDMYDFDEDSFDFSDVMAMAARKMVRATASGDYVGLARAVEYISQDQNVNPYAALGIYTPVYNKEYDEYVWTRTADSSNSIVFRSEKDKTEVSLVVSRDSWTGKFDTTDWDYDYDYDPVTGEYNYYEYDITNHWTVRVPAKMTLDMKYSGSSAATAEVESNFDEAGHKFSVKATATVANITANVNTNGTDAKITEWCDVTIGGTRVLSSTGEVNGDGLCDRKKIEQMAEMSESQLVAQIDNIFKGANVKVDLLSRIQAEAKCSSLRDIISAADYDDEELSEVRAFVNALNKNFKTTLYFGNTSYEQGSLTWDYVNEKDWGYSWYEVVPMIQLAEGGSPMSLEDFFETGTLNDAAKTIQSIVDSYCRVFGID